MGDSFKGKFLKPFQGQSFIPYESADTFRDVGVDGNELVGIRDRWYHVGLPVILKHGIILEVCTGKSRQVLFLIGIKVIIILIMEATTSIGALSY